MSGRLVYTSIPLGLYLVHLLNENMLLGQLNVADNTKVMKMEKTPVKKKKGPLLFYTEA